MVTCQSQCVFPLAVSMLLAMSVVAIVWNYLLSAISLSASAPSSAGQSPMLTYLPDPVRCMSCRRRSSAFICHIVYRQDCAASTLLQHTFPPPPTTSVKLPHPLARPTMIQVIRSVTNRSNGKPSSELDKSKTNRSSLTSSQAQQESSDVEKSTAIAAVGNGAVGEVPMHQY